MNFSQLLNDITHQDWGSVAYYILAGGGLSSLFQIVKHLAGTKWGHALVVFMVGAISVMGALVYYYFNHRANGFITFTVKDSAYLMTAMTFLYHFFVSPLYKKKIAPALETLSAAMAQVKSQKTVASPASPATPQATDAAPAQFAGE
jgi:hypothetical protein